MKLRLLTRLFPRTSAALLCLRDWPRNRRQPRDEIFEKVNGSGARFFVLANYSISSLHAAGADVIAQFHALSSRGETVFLFGPEHDSVENARFIGERDFIRALRNPLCTIILHFSFSWLRAVLYVRIARARLVVRYQNITPPLLFKDYDREMMGSAVNAYQHARLILGYHAVRQIWSSSLWTRDELKARVPSTIRRAHRILAPIGEIQSLDGYDDAAPPRSDIAPLLCVGRLVPHKNHDALFDFLEYYNSRHDFKLRLSVTGKPGLDRYGRHICSRIEGPGLSDCVRFLGLLTRENLVQAYRRSLALMVFSRHEGFCLPIVEAQMLGVPVIGLRHSAVPETAGHNALLYEEGDWAGIAMVIDRLLSDDQFRMKTIAEGHDNAKLFSQERIVGNMLQYIRSIG
jgi:glycosyltransferase involved in cell wall biosynthesis